MLIAAFALPSHIGRAGLVIAGTSVVLLIIGSLPAARAMLTPRKQERAA